MYFSSYMLVLHRFQQRQNRKLCITFSNFSSIILDINCGIQISFKILMGATECSVQLFTVSSKTSQTKQDIKNIVSTLFITKIGTMKVFFHTFKTHTDKHIFIWFQKHLVLWKIYFHDKTELPRFTKL